MNPQQQFLAWLEENDPFVYAVVKEKLMAQNRSLDGWQSLLTNVGKAVMTIAPAYVGYKQSRDASKLAKARLSFEKSQATRIVSQPAPSFVPPINTNAIAEIMRRLELAQQNKPQPPTVNYTPTVQPLDVPNYRQVVSAVASSKTPLYIGLGLSALAFLLFRLKG